MELFKLLGTIAIDTSGVDQAVNEVKSKVEVIGEHITNFGTKVSSIGMSMSAKLTAPLTALGIISTNTAANFEDGMLKVQSLTGATGEELEKLTEEAKRLGSTTAWTAKDVADAMGYMALAGFDTNEILQSISGMLSLASASGEDLGTVTDILTDSMTAFGDSANDASRYADVLATTQAKSNTTVGLLGEAFKYAAPLAGSYGYKLEDVATALGLMANAGVKGSMAGTALSSIITRLGTNTDGCRDKIEELGVEFYNSDGTARNLSDVLKDLANKTNNLTTEEKASIAKQVAGQEAMKGLLSILNQGAGAYENLERQIKSCNGVASEMATNMESGLGGSIRSLKSALEGVAITLGETLAPYIQKAAEKIKELTEWFQNLDDKTKDHIVRIGLLVAAAGPVLLVFGKVISLIGNIITVGSALITGIGKVISIGTTLASGIGKIISVAGNLISTLMTMNPTILLIVAAIGAVIAIGVLLVKNWDDISAAAGRLWSNIVEGTKKAFDAVGSFFKGIGEGLISFGKSIGETFTSIKDGISDKLHSMKENASNAFEGLKQAATEKFRSMADGISSMTSRFREGFANAMSNIADAGSKGFGMIRDKFASIGDSIGSVFDKVRNSASNIVNNLKGLLSFDWKLPDIKLPHFNIEWDENGFASGLFQAIGLKGTPKIGVDWYAEGGIMQKPTAFGINGNNLMVGGEAGAEAIAPIETLKTYIREAIDERDSKMYEVLYSIYTLIQKYMPELANKQVVLSTGETVGALAEPMSVALGKLAYKRERER